MRSAIHREAGVFFSRTILTTLILGLAITADAQMKPADPPCDKYPPAKQQRCAVVWKELLDIDGPII
ncbi:MAG: hypothetical protein OEY28_14295, partial [Nitrospira sp.]|nr:hypothetical protein [Nitrospira sp.]